MRGISFITSAAFAAVLCINGVIAAPAAPPPAKGAAPAKTPAPAKGSSGGGGVPKAPHFVVYNDRGPKPAPDVSQITGFNTVALSFILSTGAADMAKAWQTLPKSERTTIKQQYEKAGVKLIVSAFGSTELPTTSGKDPKTLASTMAKWVKDNDVDGIDVDYEDLQAMTASNGKAEQWLIDFTKALRAELPQGKYILTHAPLAPWFSTTYKSGAYLKVHKEVGSMIDWYNLQFYNQGAAEYTDCAGLLDKSKAFPGTAVFEISKAGVPMDKIVIGKPGGTADATTGYIAPDALAKCVSEATGKKWNGGVMSWQYPSADSKWIKTVKGSAFK